MSPSKKSLLGMHALNVDTVTRAKLKTFQYFSRATSFSCSSYVSSYLTTYPQEKFDNVPRKHRHGTTIDVIKEKGYCSHGNLYGPNRSSNSKMG